MVLVIVVFAGASFFFALAETALFSLSNWQRTQLAGKTTGAGKIVFELLERPQDLLATLALGNTFANAAILAVGRKGQTGPSGMRNSENRSGGRGPSWWTWLGK